MTETVATVYRGLVGWLLRATVVVYQLRCVGCDELRLGRETDEGIQPVRETCPDCGSTEYEVLAYDSEE